MKHLLQKISASKSKIVAHIKMGNDTFNIILRDDRIYGVYGGCDIFDCDRSKESYDKISCASYDFLTFCLKNKKAHSITVYKSKEAGDFESLFDRLKNIPGAKKVVLKVIPEDPSEIDITLQSSFNIEKAVDKQALVGNLLKFINIISEVNNILLVSRGDALSLTKGKIVNTMWGAKSMQNMLDSIHKEIYENEAWDRIEFFSNMIIKSIERLIYKISTDHSKVCLEEQKMICTVLIPNILENYANFKQVAMKVLITLSMLMYIDDFFKKETSYPAAWFLSSSMLGDLKQDYYKLLKFMMDSPQLDYDIVYPLDFMKLQYINGSRT